jgi:uncharacterized membrane-anchored protein YhcB (DUF1043 family)
MKDTLVGLIMFGIAIAMIALWPRHTPVHSVQTEPSKIEQLTTELESTKQQLEASRSLIQTLLQSVATQYAEREAMRHYIYMRDEVHEEGAKW